MYGHPDGEPGLESRDTVNRHYLSARVYLYYGVRRLCLSHGLEWAIRVYARRQGTTFWFILYRTMYTPLFNYSKLTNIPIPVDIIPSPPQAHHQAHPQRYTQQLPPIIYYLLISTHTHHPDLKQSPRNLEWMVFTRLFLFLKIPRD